MVPKLQSCGLLQQVSLSSSFIYNATYLHIFKSSVCLNLCLSIIYEVVDSRKNLLSAYPVPGIVLHAEETAVTQKQMLLPLWSLQLGVG